MPPQFKYRNNRASVPDLSPVPYDGRAIRNARLCPECWSNVPQCIAFTIEFKLSIPLEQSIKSEWYDRGEIARSKLLGLYVCKNLYLRQICITISDKSKNNIHLHYFWFRDWSFNSKDQKRHQAINLKINSRHQISDQVGCVGRHASNSLLFPARHVSTVARPTEARYRIARYKYGWYSIRISAACGLNDLSGTCNRPLLTQATDGPDASKW